jgi:NAD(P)H-hydrate epimerase
VVPLPEAILELIAGSGDAYAAADVAAAGGIIERYDVVVLGPGLGSETSTGEFVGGVIERARISGARLVIDADALNLIAARAIPLTGLNAVVTPHPGEAGRLLGVSAAEVQSDRFAAARELGRLLGVVVLLKGAGTVVYQGDRGVLIVEGSPFLAAPGSGDVLSGVIAGICTRTESMFDAAVLGAFAHAKAGVAASTARGGTILASEIANYLPGW